MSIESGTEVVTVWSGGWEDWSGAPGIDPSAEDTSHTEGDGALKDGQGEGVRVP